MMSFNDFVHTYRLKNKTTSDIKVYYFLSSWSLNDVGISLRNGPFSTDVGIVNLHESRGNHWVAYINDK